MDGVKDSKRANKSPSITPRQRKYVKITSPSTATRVTGRRRVTCRVKTRIWHYSIGNVVSRLRKPVREGHQTNFDVWSSSSTSFWPGRVTVGSGTSQTLRETARTCISRHQDAAVSTGKNILNSWTCFCQRWCQLWRNAKEILRRPSAAVSSPFNLFLSRKVS